MKSMAHASAREFEVWTRYPHQVEFYRMVCKTTQGGIRSRRLKLKAAVRREKAFRMAAELVIKAGVAGDEIAFYGSDVRYGRYLCRRLETLGCRVTSPLLGLNNGQRLAWLTEELSRREPASLSACQSVRDQG
jgi:hypothetical protein